METTSNSNLIPSSKRDWEAVRKWEAASPAQLIAVADDLLPWMQAMNWPIADYIQTLLLPHLPAIEGTIVRVLNQSDDDVWKYWLIACLVQEMPLASLSCSIREALWRIAEHPTAGEKDYVTAIARSVLELDS